MSNGNNTRNNLFSDLDNTDLLYINILNTIYNDNLRIINQLLGQNSEISHSLINFMNRARSQSFTNIFNDNLNQRTNMHSSNANTNTNINTNDFDDRRIFIGNIPYYIVDEVQFFTIPTTNTNTNTNDEINAPDSTPDSSGNTNLNERRRRRSTIHRNALRRHYENNPNITNEVLGSPIDRTRGFLNSFLQPITVRPTQAQIENATSTLVYGEIVDPINTSCPISLETFTETSEVTMIKHCKHIFNRQNLMSWFNSNCKCPVCRYDIRDYINTETNETNENIHETGNTDVNVNRQQHMRNIRNITDETVNILENLFHDALYDLSYNNLQFSFR